MRSKAVSQKEIRAEILAIRRMNGPDAAIDYAIRHIAELGKRVADLEEKGSASQ